MLMKQFISSVCKLQRMHAKLLQHTILNGNIKGGYIDVCQNTKDNVNVTNIKVYESTIINVNMKYFQQIVNLNEEVL